MNIIGFIPVKDRPQYIKALIYGEAGSGKTLFCASSDNPIYFDFESSTETLRHYPEYSHIPVKKPKNVEELRKDVQEAILDPEVETIVIDTITTSLDYYLRQRMDSVATKRDKYQLYEADYKYATQVYSDLFGFLQDAPINVAILGHERVSLDPDTNKVNGIFPDITPRLRQAVTRLVNVVGYLQVEPSGMKGVTRRLYVNKTRIIEAKNRLAISEVYIEQPTWKSVFG